MIKGYSSGIDNVLWHLNPQKRPHGEAHFPKGWAFGAGPIKSSDSLADWFKRCLDLLPDHDPGACQVEENFGLFVSVAWGSRDGERFLRYVNAQAIVVNDATLADLYLAGAQAPRTTYY